MMTTLDLEMTNGIEARDHDEFWQAILQRNPDYEGKFIVAVRSTRIYCRPTCPSRFPNRENVVFYPTTTAAAAAGFRACKRCKPDDRAYDTHVHITLAQQICDYLTAAESAPTLDELSQEFHISPYHLQRVFKRVTGVSPKQYYDTHRANQFKNGLKDGEPVTKALYDAGYSSSSQLYPGILGMTPTTYRRGGAGMQIRYSIVPCYLGMLLVAGTERGVCAIRLMDDNGDAVAELNAEYPKATVYADDEGMREWVNAVLAYLERQPTQMEALPLDIQATAFQTRVWSALKAIPYGSVRSYSEIAEAIGQPTAARAVAQACASNPVPLIIPCHRVVREGGELGGYSMGIERKRKLLEAEGSLHAAMVDVTPQQERLI